MAVGILSHIAVDAGQVLVIPLGGVILYAAERHPLAGIAAAFAGVSGGFSATFFLPSSLDPLLAGSTQTAAHLRDASVVINPLNNFYFTSAERRGLWAAAAAMLLAIGLIFVFFLIPGVVFGYRSGAVKTHRDVVAAMSKAMSGMGYYVVMAFFCAQFIYAFGQSNLGALLAIKGAQALRDSGQADDQDRDTRLLGETAASSDEFAATHNCRADTINPRAVDLDSRAVTRVRRPIDKVRRPFTRVQQTCDPLQQTLTRVMRPANARLRPPTTSVRPRAPPEWPVNLSRLRVPVRDVLTVAILTPPPRDRG